MDVYERTIKKWGHDAQINMMIEECAEVIVALRHYSRRKASLRAVCSELADVEIMSAQMRISFSNKLIEQEKEIKLLRLESILTD